MLRNTPNLCGRESDVYGTFFFRMDSSDTRFSKAFAVLIIAILVVLSYKAFMGNGGAVTGKPILNAVCEGQALAVDYPYQGGMIPPHACAPQCEDNVQRYVLYSNGKATQCQMLPGCLDWGEDQGVTCVMPEMRK